MYLFESLLHLNFSSKSQKSNNITLTERSKVTTYNEKCADTFNSYFNSVVKELKLPINEDLLQNVIDIDDPILASTEKYKRHPNILKIKG